MIEKELTIGQNLKRKREGNKIPLEHISEVTRITIPNLQALERDEFQRLPGEFFTRGFLRNYAKVVNLDPDEVITAYRCQTEANRKQVLDESSISPPSISFLRNIRNHLFDFVSTIMGATPTFSLHKAILPPKD